MESVDVRTSLEKKPMVLPEIFIKFLAENKIDPQIYEMSSKIPRYIRLKTGISESLVLRDIEVQLGHVPTQLPWLPCFFSLPSALPIASCQSYKKGQVFGMDAASAAAVIALGIQCEDHVLDLCAAPGAKLLLMSDEMGPTATGTLTAVDISRSRLASCRTLLKKYGLGDRCRLFLADGVRFSVGPPVARESTSDGKLSREFQAKESSGSSEGCKPFVETSVGAESDKIGSAEGKSESEGEIEPPAVESVGREGRTTSGRLPRKDRRRTKVLTKKFSVNGEGKEWENRNVELFFAGKDAWQWWGPPYDNLPPGLLNMDSSGSREWGYNKVLVDAECTHDGSVKHLEKFDQWGWDTFEQRFFDPTRISELRALQRGLLANGFQLLRYGGTLVYSTCSLTVAQNEDIVGWFLEKYPEAEIERIPNSENWPCRSGGIAGTLRFDPLTSATSGLFVARFRKVRKTQN